MSHEAFLRAKLEAGAPCVLGRESIDYILELLTMQIIDTQTVYVVWQNADGTEGRGPIFPIAVCRCLATAMRLAKGKDVQGSDCRVTEETAFKVSGSHAWFGPCKIIPPSIEDWRMQVKKDKRAEALEHAKSLGLSDDDIEALSK